MNHQRARRLSNRFKALETEIDTLPNDEILRRTSAKDRRHAHFAAQLLRLETLLMRAREEDVRSGMSLAQKLSRTSRKPEARIEFNSILSILSQQLATAYAMKGRLSDAMRMQQQASRAYYASLSHGKEMGVDQRARYLTVQTKYNPLEDTVYKADDLKIAIEEAEAGQLRSLTYIADAELNFKSRHFEKVARAVDEALKVCGYGQDFDYARSIVLRRRWWALNLLAGEKCDPELLKQDIRLWRSINMHNEIRELSLLLQKANAYTDRRRTIRTLENVLVSY